MNRLAIYPVGTIVMLNNRQLAVVTEQGSQADRPLVFLITDPQLELITPSSLALEKNPEVEINKALADYPSYVLKQIPPGRQDSFFAASGYLRT